MKVLGGLKKGLVFVISAPAGTGKTTLARMLTEEFDCVVESVSYTTRKPRAKEVNGVDYHFVSDAVFKEMQEAGGFLESAEVFGYSYGTSRKGVDELTAGGKHVVLVIDTQGAMQLQKTLKATYIFILPPDLDELKKRLHGRDSESAESIVTRLSWAGKEIELAKHYDYQIVNENLKNAYQILRSILIAEEHRTARS